MTREQLDALVAFIEAEAALAAERNKDGDLDGSYRRTAQRGVQLLYEAFYLTETET